MKGAEYPRVMASSDTRIHHRVYTYLDNGTGIRPESNVGTIPKIVRMTNMYDLEGDPLGLIQKHNGDMSAVESAILDAGYDGYFVRQSLDG